MPYQPRQYQLVDLPRGPDPMQSLAGLMSIANSLEDRKTAREENMYRRRERARVDEDRQTMQSAQSSALPPEEVKKQLTQLGRGDLVPVYEEARTGLEANRLRLKAARDASALADKDYWGHLGYVVTKANGDPLAIEYTLREAEQDGHDVAQAREALKASPDAWKPLAERLIANSPAQQERIAKEAELLKTDKAREEESTYRRLTIERQDQAARDAAAKDAATNARLAAADKAEADYRKRMLELSTTKGSATLTPSEIARIETTYADALNELDMRRKGRPGAYPNEDTLVGALSDAEYATQKRRLDEAYRRRLGTAAPATSAPPSYVKPTGGVGARSRVRPQVQRQPIPGIPGGEAELRDGRWVRVR